jgi:hypothetical protein
MRMAKSLRSSGEGSTKGVEKDLTIRMGNLTIRKNNWKAYKREQSMEVPPLGEGS